MRILLLILLFIISANSFAQEILGNVTDSVTKEPLVNATITVKLGGILKGGGSTDFDGRYSIIHLDVGYYEVSASYIPYKAITQSNTIVAANEKTTLDFTLLRNEESPRKEIVINYHKPMSACGRLGPYALIQYNHPPRPALPLLKIIDPLVTYQAYYNNKIFKITHGNFKSIKNPSCYLHPVLYIIDR